MAYEPKNSKGAVFANDKGDNPKRPDYKGDLMTPDGKLLKLSGWTQRTKDGKAFLSLVCEYERPRETELDTADEPERDGQLPF